MKMLGMIAAAAGLSLAAPAGASIYLAEGLAQPRMTYTTLDQVRTSRTSGYSGVGSLFVSTLSTRTTGRGSLCTGSLIGSGTVLTAAHCLETAAGDPITSIRFYLPSFGDRDAATTEVFYANAYALNPAFAATGLIGGNDVALFSITGDTSGHDIYDLFDGNPLQTYTEVGTGTIGGPEGTNIGVTSDYLKRVGTNIYEYYGDDVFLNSTRGVVLYDFDDGTPEHDVFGSIGGNKQTGIPGEASSSPGDSGGPAFIDGKIATVTSFGITGAVFNDYCGGDSIDPYNNAGSTAVTTDLSLCTNSSVGEIGGNTLVSYNIGFIRGYLNGTVAISAIPEPATWLTMILGFGLAAIGLRRQPRVRLGRTA